MRIFKSNQAFTLIEVLASITLLSIILAIFLPFFANSIELSSKTEDKLTAINLAEERLNDVINNPENYFHLTNNPITVKNLPDHLKYININTKKYTVKIDILTEKDTDALKLLTIKLSILGKDNKHISDLYGYVELNK